MILFIVTFANSTVGILVGKQLFKAQCDDNYKKVEVSDFKSVESYEVQWMGPIHGTRGSGTCFLKFKL